MTKMEKSTVTIKLNLKILATLVSIAIPCLASAKPNYDDVDLDQFEKNNTCIKCDLTNASIYGKENATLDEAILIEAILKGDFTNSSFIKSILTQSNFSDYHPFVMISQFQESTMQYANASSVSFSGSNFESANLRNVNFTRANLSSVNFTNADITNSKLDNSVLIGSNLTQEQLNTAASFYCAVLPNGALAAPQNESSSCK